MRRFPCVIFSLLAGTASAGAAQQCLQVRDIASFSQDGREDVQVKTYENRLYDVRFSAPCAHHLNSHFVYQPWHLGRCLSSRDTLQMNTGGACVVASVQEVPSNLPPGSGHSPEVY
jgi:hypothetical protein